MANISRYEPWSLLSQLSNEIDRVFDGRAVRSRADAVLPASDWVPSVDVKEEKDCYVIHADVPGVDSKDIRVAMENGGLSISGERKHQSTEEREKYKRVERSYGSFYRRFSLPDNVNGDAITAKCKNGVLEVVIPKRETGKARNIEVEG